MEEGKGIHCAYEPGTFRPLANKDNDYLVDRRAQQDKRAYSGIFGFAIQNASLRESRGQSRTMRPKNSCKPTARS